jgi:PPOX class probable F420-dependent enzyme
MTAGRCRSLAELPEPVGAVIEVARRAVLATVDAAGRPHAVPITFALAEGNVVTAIDQKPKSSARPARLLNIERRPETTVLFDSYDDDWRRLAWAMVRGTARLEPPGSHLDALAARYPQYRDDPPRGEVIVVRPDDIVWWTFA